MRRGTVNAPRQSVTETPPCDDITLHHHQHPQGHRQHRHSSKPHLQSFTTYASLADPTHTMHIPYLLKAKFSSFQVIRGILNKREGGEYLEYLDVSLECETKLWRLFRRGIAYRN